MCHSGLLRTAHTFTQHLALRSTAHDNNIKGAGLMQGATDLARNMHETSDTSAKSGRLLNGHITCGKSANCTLSSYGFLHKIWNMMLWG